VSGRNRGQSIGTAAATFGAAALRALPWLLLAVLLLLLGWRSAGWLWRLWPVPAPAVGLVEANSPVASSVARHWFGVAPPPAPAPTGLPVAAPSASNVKLLGVIAGGPRPAAILKIDNTSYEALVGEEFADGWRLLAVEPDAVRLLRSGREMRIVLVVPDAAMTTRKP
jgi:hypothetical protein